MVTNTLSYCYKCQSLNNVNIQSIERQIPVCGKCKSPLKMHSLVTEVDNTGLLKMIQKSGTPVLIDFWAPWCGPCKSFAPTFEAASKLYGGKIIFVKINTQDFPEASEQFKIRGIPSLLIFKNGKEIARESGAFPLERLKNWLSKFIS